ncbi:MAG: NAD(+) diphosphatase [Lentisphaeria bacterium]|nr:NAD(+) diphosphatase [Lentisphaeria bacterium]
MRDFIPTPILKNTDKCTPETKVIAISGKKVLVTQQNGRITLPRLSDMPAGSIDTASGLAIGKLRDEECAGFIFTGKEDERLFLLEMRSAFTMIPPGSCYALCRAKSLLEWKKRRNFCGACGAALVPSENDIAMKCPVCKEPFYPQLAPAVIVAITKDDKILLAHNFRFQERVHSLIAGFVEAGESIEQAVAREIYEETHLNVCDLRYVSSQSWPFPNSLMLGFTAKYHSGTLELDGTELECANWYTPDDLPQLPEKGSIARMIIDDFCSEKRFFD